jgi:hypothetical protein
VVFASADEKCLPQSGDRMPAVHVGVLQKLPDVTTSSASVLNKAMLMTQQPVLEPPAAAADQRHESE